MARLLDPPSQHDYPDSLSDSDDYDESEDRTSALGYSELSTVNQEADWEQQVDVDSVSLWPQAARESSGLTVFYYRISDMASLKLTRPKSTSRYVSRAKWAGAKRGVRMTNTCYSNTFSISGPREELFPVLDGPEARARGSAKAAVIESGRPQDRLAQS